MAADLTKLSSVVLLDRLERAHDNAMAARQRYHQYCGYETGRKAKCMEYKHEETFSLLTEELRRRFSAGH